MWQTSLPEGELANVLQNLKSQLSEDGHVLLVEGTPSGQSSIEVTNFHILT
jgi:hypothetical protein